MWSSSGSEEVKQHITPTMKKQILTFSRKTVSENIIADGFKQGGRKTGRA